MYGLGQFKIQGKELFDICSVSTLIFASTCAVINIFTWLISYDAETTSIYVTALIFLISPSIGGILLLSTCQLIDLIKDKWWHRNE